MQQVTVSAYDPLWADQYEAESKQIVQALDGIVIGMEHIGSTAIPGLAAKPVIDMMAGVQLLEDVTDLYKDRLREIGYEFVDHAHFPERRFFRKGQWRAGTHHLHIYAYGSDHWNNQLLFKQYVTKYPEVLEAYSELKKGLEARHKADRVAYTEAKAPFIEEILRKARLEANSCSQS
ncbi:GrpB family protein [Paenibacillus filicis]|uniref:GrpB family protein n=1 Tax=Paenibacillus filicis TaxID=669464 RepID=A0ABU9DFN0_9BACL